MNLKKNFDLILLINSITFFILEDINEDDGKQDPETFVFCRRGIVMTLRNRMSFK